MESVRWICIQARQEWEKKGWFCERTLDFTRKASKHKLLDGSNMDWNEAKKYGWTCVKVELKLVEI